MSRWVKLFRAAIALAVLIGVYFTVLFLLPARPGAAILSGPTVFNWRNDSPAFGGLSALIVEDAGTTLTAASDQGTVFHARITRADDEITAVTDVAEHPIPEKPPLKSGHRNRDLEGLTRMADGRLGLSFEDHARLESIDALGHAPQPLHHWDRFFPFFGNHSLEALATLPDGALLTIVEREEGPETSKGFIYEGGKVRRSLEVPRSAGYLITGADIGPDQCLYLVERQFHLTTGFRFRVTRVWQDGGTWSIDGAWRHEVLYESAYGLDNFEGIAAWVRGSDLRLTLISDDGFLPIIQTKLIEFTVRPEPACAG